MMIRTSTPDCALIMSALRTALGGTKYGVSMYMLLLAHPMRVRNSMPTGFSSGVTGSPGMICIATGFSAGSAAVNSGRPLRSSLSEYIHRSAKSSSIFPAWGPTILTAASLHSPRGPSPRYSFPMLYPPW